MRILVVEPDLGVARSLCDAIASTHEVVIEANSVSALGRVSTAEYYGTRFELVFCASHMTGVDCPDFVTAMHRRREAPAVVVISHGASEVAGADATLFVPFTETDVAFVIANVIAAKRAAKTQSLRRPVVALT